jgi:hypothetical protein
MNIRKLLILLWSVLATVSCLIDYVNYSYIEFVNKSSVEVKFINKEGEVIESIAAGERGKLNAPDVLCPPAYIYEDLRVMAVIYDNAIMLNISEGRLASEDSYKALKGRDHYRSYRYTFTDEDYQYALENGQKVDQK